MTALKEQTQIKYLLGIDGGGTKTEFLLTDFSKKEIKRIILAASNPASAGIENTKAILEQGIDLICSDINRKEISVFAGIAGSSSTAFKNEINKFLSNYGFGVFSNGSDTNSLIETALGDEDGVAVIMGTGIVAFAQVNQKLHRIGGWGYLIDKGGSGYNFGADALESALKQYDGRGGSELIAKLIQTKLDKPLTDCISQLYQGGAAYIASFAPTVFEAFSLGDKEAERIIDRNCKETAQLIDTGCKHLSNPKVVICGGLCKQKDILEPFITKHLQYSHPLSFSTEPMVNGAISLAERGIKTC